jgi:hypothetical protein
MLARFTLDHDSRRNEPMSTIVALVPRAAPPAKYCAGLWSFTTRDGRIVVAVASSFDDAARLAREIFPDAGEIEARKLKSELGVPPI